MRLLHPWKWRSNSSNELCRGLLLILGVWVRVCLCRLVLHCSVFIQLFPFLRLRKTSSSRFAIRSWKINGWTLCHIYLNNAQQLEACCIPSSVKECFLSTETWQLVGTMVLEVDSDFQQFHLTSGMNVLRSDDGALTVESEAVFAQYPQVVPFHLLIFKKVIYILG